MASTDLKDSEEDARTGLSPANRALEDQRRTAAGRTPGTQAEIDQLNAGYGQPSAKGEGANRGPGSDKKSAASPGNIAGKAVDTVGKGFNPEAMIAKSAVSRISSTVLGSNNKQRRNRLVGTGLVTAIVGIGMFFSASFIIQHEAIHIEEVVGREELKLLDDVEGHADKRVLKRVFGKAKDTKAAEEDAKANPKEPLTDEIDEVAAEPHKLDGYIEQQGLTPEYSDGNLTEIEDGDGKAVTPDDAEASGLVDDVVTEGRITTFDPVVVGQVGEPLDPFPASDPDSTNDPQKELSDGIKNGAGDEAIAQADGSINEQEAKQTGNKQKDAANAEKVAEEESASGPLADAIKAANEVASNGGTASEAISAGVKAFKAKLGASLTDKFFITAMVTMLCNFEKAVQVASDARVPEIMTLLMRNGGQFLAFSDHEKNSGGGPANAPTLTSGQVKAMMTVVEGDPGAIAPTSSDPDPVEDMPFTRSAEWNHDVGNTITNTSNPAGANYTPAVTAAASPTRNAGQVIVDTIATFMRDTGFSFACTLLTSTFGVIFQLAAGLGQIISSIGSFGAADAAILAGNVALQQFLFSYVLPQVLAYFTNLGVGLVSPVPFINNVGVGVNLSAGTTSRFEGALPQSNSDTKKILGQIADQQYIEEQQKPLMYRAFAMDNPYSLTYRLMNNLPSPLNANGVFSTVASYFTSLPNTLGHTIAGITSPHVFAATETQLNPNTAGITQYYASTDYVPDQNEQYLRNPKDGADVTVDGKTATRITMLGDPYAYQMSPAGDSDTNDLLHCFVDSPTLLTDTASPNPNQKFCGALGTYDYASDNPAKLGVPNDATVVKIYCTYFGNPPSCPQIVAPQVHDDVDHFSQYLGDKAAITAIGGLVGAN